MTYDPVIADESAEDRVNRKRGGTRMNDCQFSEWFWSEASAKNAAERLEAKGYRTQVRYAMRADWSSWDWLLEASF